MPLRAAPDGVVLRVRLQPGASASRIDGVERRADGTRRLKVRVTAAPERGKANQALLGLLAEASGLPKSGFEISGGAGRRDKQVLARGDTAALRPRLQAWLDTLPRRGVGGRDE